MPEVGHLSAYTRSKVDVSPRKQQKYDNSVQGTSHREIRLTRQDTSQSSRTLLPSVIAPGFAQNGQDPPNSGQVPSLTSTNNFINFCLTVPNLPITDGKQITAGSCNPAPMGHLPSSQNMPSTKITQPRNGDVFAENTPFTVTIATKNLQAANSANAETNYLSAPQQLGTDGNIMGHYHLVIEELSSFDQKTVTDPKVFTLFKEIFALSTDITGGIPAGLYRMTVTTHTANHQQVLVPLGQHGSLNDAVYFTVTQTLDGRNIKSSPMQLLPPVRRDGLHNSHRLLRGSTVPSRLKTRKTSRGKIFRRAISDDQTSTTLNPSIIASGFENDGQGANPQAGQIASLTSSNNFINYCATLTNVPLTNGKQLTSESCNPAPMGVLPSEDNIPSVRFTFPSFNSTLPINVPFIITLATGNLEAGQFANSQSSYLAAPQQLTSDGKIRGYVAIVIESISSMSQTIPTNPLEFAFAQSIPQPSDANGLLSTNMSSGLPVGIYRLSSSVRTANHQPVLAPLSIHGSIDDVVYFSVGSSGSLLPGQIAAPSSVPATFSTSGTSSASSAVPTNSRVSDPDSTHPNSSRHLTGLAVGASLGAIIIVLVILALFWRFRKAQIKVFKSRYIYEQPNTFSLTPFTARNATIPVDPSVDNRGISRKDSPRYPAPNDASNSTSHLTEGLPDRPEAGTSKRNERRRPSRTRRSQMSDRSLAPSYHTTLERSS